MMGITRTLRVGANRLTSNVVHSPWFKSLKISRKGVVLIGALALLLLVWILTLPSYAARIPVPVQKFRVNSPDPENVIIDKTTDSRHTEAEDPYKPKATPPVSNGPTSTLSSMRVLSKQRRHVQRFILPTTTASIPIPGENLPTSASAHPILQASDQLVTQSMDIPDILKLGQLDPRLWEHIKSNHIFPPSKLPYHYPYGYDIPSNKSLQFIDKPVDEVLQSIFMNMTDGIFVEVRGFDGWWSHTLWYEVNLNWTGLLIECHPALLPILKSINRKAYIADVCLSPGRHPENGRLTSLDKDSGSRSMGSDLGASFPGTPSNLTVLKVQTVPLYAIMAAVSIRQVDLFILDIHILEIPVLRNFPFDLVHVKVWVLVVAFLEETQKYHLRRFMEDKGYSRDRYWERSSYAIFIHESVIEPSITTLLPN